MGKYVERHIASCVECIVAKRKSGKQAGEIHPIPPVSRSFEIMHADHLGPFVTSKRGMKYILAFICNLTKFVQLYTVTSTKAAPVVQKLEGFVNRFGAPKRFITDRGTAFTSSKFESFVIVTESNTHSTLLVILKRMVKLRDWTGQFCLTDSEGFGWDLGVPRLERDLNISICKSTGRTPFEIIYGYIPRFHDSRSRQLTEESEKF